ncbi:MAG: MBL fold metallo-hydrolase [Melioribacteraceae bacterium]|nr:MBL fold metallo-hydrolase [Melioribacteraceae bacterium]MCF8353774.1 MBL fold metallo-hydrolase [Melioribacteraceae bacterium]MCF8393610.1 MBL fold metallo-hydrolase [Melioribacteraceae bacterium]MCF8419420.1 MBL fold metallo-hydrolase [Melioribacteraceae bacterium]
MFYEIDFLPVDSGEKSGDAICLRYGETEESQTVMVIDGGTSYSGENMIKHIKKFYNTDFVNYVVSTHPDGDHVSGLRKIVEEMDVGELWMHQPWNYAEELKDKFKDSRFTTEGLEKKLRESYPLANELESIAIEKEIPIKEPFQGERIGNFLVLSPFKDWYLELVPQFSNTPEPKEITEGFLKKSVRAILNWVDEEWDVETLSTKATTSPSNESCVILYGELEESKILFTADAGVLGLDRAADYANGKGYDLSGCTFIQIPHHGSRNNVTPQILNGIVGEKVGKDGEKTKTAFVSVSKDSETHPRRVVTNAFNRRGANIGRTNGKWICYFNRRPDRPNMYDLDYIPFYNKVEESD